MINLYREPSAWRKVTLAHRRCRAVLTLGRTLLILGAGIAFTSARTSAAPILVYTETILATGVFQYDFTAKNSLNLAAYNLYDVIFSFPDVPTVIAVPAGWNFLESGNFVEAFSLYIGAPPTGTDLPSGAMLDGFLFQTDTRADIPFAATFSNVNDDFDQLVIRGISTPIETALEPSTFILSLIGMGMAAGAGFRTFEKKLQNRYVRLRETSEFTRISS